MATFGTSAEFNRLVKAAPADEREHRRNAEQEEARAGDVVLDAVGSLLEVFTTLPQALGASRRAELARLRSGEGAPGSAAEEIEQSIEALDAVEGLARLGRARLTRAMAGLKVRGSVFSGFVATADGLPVEGLRVQVTTERTKGQATGVVAADGYFTVPLDDLVGAGSLGFADAQPFVMERPETPAGEPLLATISVLGRGQTVLYEDPIPMHLDGGSAYREYQVDAPSASPARQPASGRGPR